MNGGMHGDGEAFDPDRPRAGGAGSGGRGCDWVGELAGSESRVGLGAAWEDTAGVGAVLTLQDLLLLSHLSRV